MRSPWDAPESPSIVLIRWVPALPAQHAREGQRRSRPAGKPLSDLSGYLRNPIQFVEHFWPATGAKFRPFFPIAFPIRLTLVADLSPPFSTCAGSTRVSASFSWALRR